MKLFKTWLVEKEGLDDDGNWVDLDGSGAASGVLPICSATKKLCLAWRSDAVNEGDCWGVFGGAIPKDMTPEQSASKELKQEAGYDGPVKLTAAYVFKKGSFKFHNFIGMVPKEFEFDPEPDFAWETDRIVWFHYNDLIKEIASHPHSFHPGVIELFRKSKGLIEKAVSV